MVAATHALVFAVIYHFTHKFVWNPLYEGFNTCPQGLEYQMGKVEERDKNNKVTLSQLVKGCYPIRGSKVVPKLICPVGKTATRDTTKSGLGGWGCK